MFAAPIKISRKPTNQFNNQVSTEDTIREMNGIVSKTWNSPEVFSACEQALDNPTTEREIAEGVWHWIKAKVKFVTDEESMKALGIEVENPTKELLISPPTLITMPTPQGDCDDFSMLAKAMILCCGLRGTFITIKADKEQPEIWSHVYCKCYFSNGKGMMMDCSHGHWPGWETNNYWEKREWV